MYFVVSQTIRGEISRGGDGDSDGVALRVQQEDKKEVDAPTAPTGRDLPSESNISIRAP